MPSIEVNGQILDWNEGLTIRDVLQKMRYTFRMLVIKINGSLVKKADYDTTLVPEGAIVEVIHMISGG
jgi:sulfur carrier protein